MSFDKHCRFSENIFKRNSTLIILNIFLKIPCLLWSRAKSRPYLIYCRWPAFALCDAASNFPGHHNRRNGLLLHHRVIAHRWKSRGSIQSWPPSLLVHSGLQNLSSLLAIRLRSSALLPNDKLPNLSETPALASKYLYSIIHRSYYEFIT